jgi:hypothetical protein
MPSIERTDAQCEGEVIRPFTWRERERLGRRLPKRELPLRELGLRPRARLLNGFGRTVDAEDVRSRPTSNNLSRCDARSTTNLEDPQSWPERKRIDGLEDPSRHG